MAYLISPDYRKIIASDNLNQVIASNQEILSSAESLAVEEAKSYLVQRYDTSIEMQDLSAWNPALATYKPTNRVCLDADQYNEADSYTVGDLALYQSNVYQCTADTTGAFDANNWAKLGKQYEIYFADFPKPLFSFYDQYAVGDQVYHNGKIYQCLHETTPLSQSAFLQYRTVSNLPLLNVAPDNIAQGPQYWKYVSDYTIAADTAISNTSVWTKGDNRSQQLVSAVVDICLYHVHSRIAPRNIPDLRVKRYDDAISWLKKAAAGEVTPSLPLIEPKRGASIRYGGNVKNVNSY